MDSITKINAFKVKKKTSARKNICQILLNTQFIA